MSIDTRTLTPEEKAAVERALAGVSKDAKFALTGWGKDAMKAEWDIQCPSGQWCRVRKIRFEDLLALGVLDNLDMFSSMMIAGSEAQTGAAEIKMLEGFQDPEKRAKFMGTVNKVVAAGVVAPEVVLVDDGNLPEGSVFAGDIEFQDKMFLFGMLFRGRVDQLATFREAEASGVGDVAEGQSLPEDAS